MDPRTLDKLVVDLLNDHVGLSPDELTNAPLTLDLSTFKEMLEEAYREGVDAGFESGLRQSLEAQS